MIQCNTLASGYPTNSINQPGLCADDVSVPILNNYQRSVILVVLGGLFLSTLGIGVRLMEDASSFQITFYRAVSQAIFVSLILWMRNRGGVYQAFSQTGKMGFLAGFMFAGASIFIVMAVTNTTVANAMFIVSMAPFVSALLAWIFLREVVSMKTLCAIAIAVFGVVIMINGALSGDGMLGIAYALMVVMFYAGFTVCLRSIKGGDLLVATCWGSYLTLIILAFVISDFSISSHDLIMCLLLGVFQIGLGGLCLALGSKYVPAAQIPLLAMLEVVLNPIWVWLGVGEVPGQMTLIGGAFIFAAIVYQAVTPTKAVAP